jgi:hypothetical protein
MTKLTATMIGEEPLSGLPPQRRFTPEDTSMIYEVRTYTLRIPEFEERYEKRLPARLKHSRLGAFWHIDFGPLN